MSMTPNVLNTIADETTFSAVRIGKTSTILLEGDIACVFPLFGPLREMEWADGWSPQILYGEHEVSEYMVFRTKPNSGQDECFQWIVAYYRPIEHGIGYTVTATDRVWFIDVQCKTHGAQTLATVTYTYIGLSAEGHQHNCLALDRMFAFNLQDWEEAINHYLRTGQKLKTSNV